jgi:hypothetical protein
MTVVLAELLAAQGGGELGGGLESFSGRTAGASR